jgi:hypothetical protein
MGDSERLAVNGKEWKITPKLDCLTTIYYTSLIYGAEPVHTFRNELDFTVKSLCFCFCRSA